MYQHHDWQGTLLDLPVSKVVCVGRNYQDHIEEMGSERLAEPVLFMKPETALCNLKQPIIIPKNMGAVHHELELAVLIGSVLKQASEEHVARSIAGYGVALDLTLREIQAASKKAGLPWEKSKAFDGSCPVSGFIPTAQFGDPQQAQITITVNGETRQDGNTSNMIHPVLPLISYMSRYFTLRAGDIILTGTPSGVNALNPGDVIQITLNDKSISTRVL